MTTLEPESPALSESAPEQGESAPRHVTSVGKALRLLAAFRGITPPVGVSELARRSGLPKSTAFRFLADLEQVGFVEREGSDYRLGLSLFELGSRVNFCRPNGLRDLAMPHMSKLHVATGLNTHLSLLEGHEVVHISKVNHGVGTLKLHLQPGSRVPASCSAMGKAMLAFSDKATLKQVIEAGLPRRTAFSITEVPRLLRELAAIRQNGVALDKEETALGTVGFAAPIIAEGKVIAAVGVTMPAPIANTARTSAHVRAAAEAISVDHANWAKETW